MVRSARECKGRLPAERTSFVDRRAEIAAVKRLVSASRLVTLTGVGGTGKTRLAVRVAAGVRRAFAAGAWLVDLAPVWDARVLELAVAETLDLSDQTDRPVSEVLAGYLHVIRVEKAVVFEREIVEKVHRGDDIARFVGANQLVGTEHRTAESGDARSAVGDLSQKIGRVATVLDLVLEAIDKAHETADRTVFFHAVAIVDPNQ